MFCIEPRKEGDELALSLSILSYEYLAELVMVSGEARDMSLVGTYVGHSFWRML